MKYVQDAQTLRTLEGLDLIFMASVAGIGADMIRPNVLEIFAETFKDCGFDKRGLHAELWT